MGLMGKILGKEKTIRFSSVRDVNKAEESKRRAELRRAEQEAYQKAYAQGRIARASREGAMAGSKRWYDSFANIGISSPAPSRNVTRGVSRGSKKKKKGKHRRRTVGRRSGGMFDVGNNFDIADNWGFFK